MPKAGMFAGEVTPLAPADNAPTDKAKGYWWMEYGTVATGLCGTLAALDQGELLSVNVLQDTQYTSDMVEANSYQKGILWQDSKIISFTFAFSRLQAPSAGYFVTAIHIYNPSRSTYDVFSIVMDENGHLLLEGSDDTGALILDAVITNNGGSFAGGATYFCAAVIDLSDPANREFYINNVNVAENPAYFTWNTYVDAEFALEDTGIAPNGVIYKFGGHVNGNPYGYWYDASIQYNNNHEADRLGMISFDDNCSLVSASCWDGAGWIRDPQAWEGWYLTQPMIFCGGSSWRNTGRSGPESVGQNGLERGYDGTSWVDYTNWPDTGTIINYGIAGTTEST